MRNFAILSVANRSKLPRCILPRMVCLMLLIIVSPLCCISWLQNHPLCFIYQDDRDRMAECAWHQPAVCESLQVSTTTIRVRCICLFVCFCFFVCVCCVFVYLCICVVVYLCIWLALCESLQVSTTTPRVMGKERVKPVFPSGKTVAKHRFGQNAIPS